MKQNVFLVEDEPDIALLIRHHLEGAGFSVSGFGSAAGVLEKAELNRPDLFLLDIMLPGSNGLDLCRRIRKTPALSKVPIILVTARTGEPDRVVGLYNLAGTIAADGNGEFSGEVAESYPGVGTCHAGLTGKYSIDSTGSGTGSLVLSLSAINGGECRASSILFSVLLALEVGQSGASFVFSESDGKGALAGTALKQ